MDVQLTLPQTPVSLAPGVATRVPVELSNPYGPPVSVSVSVGRGRAAGWAESGPVVVTVEPGATATVELVLRPPADQPAVAALVPFTVTAALATTGEPVGYATGLLTVAHPVPVHGVLSQGATHAYDLRLVNDSDRATAVRISTKLDPPLGTSTAEPAAVQLEAGGAVTATIRARPARPIFGAPKPYAVVIAVHDAADPDGPPLLSEVGTGNRNPRVPNWLAGTVAILLALGATAAVAFSGIRLPMPGRRNAAPAATTAAATAAATPAGTPVPVRRPYALIEVVAHSGADGGLAAAEAQQAKLTAAGMPVRLVDSLASDVLADDNGGFWVLLQDGFATETDASAFCTRWRLAAPKCTVTTS